MIRVIVEDRYIIISLSLVHCLLAEACSNSGWLFSTYSPLRTQNRLNHQYSTSGNCPPVLFPSIRDPASAPW